MAAGGHAVCADAPEHVGPQTLCCFPGMHDTGDAQSRPVPRPCGYLAEPGAGGRGSDVGGGGEKISCLLYPHDIDGVVQRRQFGKGFYLIDHGFGYDDRACKYVPPVDDAMPDGADLVKGRDDKIEIIKDG